jgi:hypothetical protein
MSKVKERLTVLYLLSNGTLYDRSISRAIAQAVSLCQFPPRQPWFERRSGHVGFMVDKVALGQVFSEYFGFPCRFSFHQLLHIHILSSALYSLDIDIVVE